MVAIPIPPDQGQLDDSFDLDPQETLAQPDTKAVGPATTEEVVPALPERAGGWSMEDQTFEGSDIEIRAVLFRANGHPEGRLVQILIQNFAGVRESGWFREHQLTHESAFDQLQEKGINVVFQRFWVRLEEQKKATTSAKKRPTPAPIAPTAPAPAAVPIPPAPPPVARPAIPATQQYEFF